MHPISIRTSNLEFIIDRTNEVKSKNNSSNSQSSLKINQNFQGTQTTETVINCSKSYLKSNFITSHLSNIVSKKPIKLSKPLEPHVGTYSNEEKRDSVKKTPQEDEVLHRKRVDLYNVKLEAYNRKCVELYNVKLESYNRKCVELYNHKLEAFQVSKPLKPQRQKLKRKSVEDEKKDEVRNQHVFRSHWSRDDDAFFN